MEFDENLNPINPNSDPQWSQFSPESFSGNFQPVEKPEAAYTAPAPEPKPITPPPPVVPPTPVKLASEPVIKKNTTLNANLIVFIVSLVLMAAIAITAMLVGWQPASASISNNNGLTVTGTGEAFMTPDVAKITFAVRTETKDIANSQKNNSETIAKIKTALAGFSIDPSDIKTVQYNINPEYDYYQISKPRLRGYTTYHSLMLTIRKLDDTDTIVQTLGTSGATEISQVNFTVDDPSEVQNEAREKAIQSAKDKATQIASLSSAQLGRIISIIEVSPDNNYPQLSDGMGGGGGLEAGSAAITSIVTLTYDLK